MGGDTEDGSVNNPGQVANLERRRVAGKRNHSGYAAPTR